MNIEARKEEIELELAGYKEAYKQRAIDRVARACLYSITTANDLLQMSREARDTFCHHYGVSAEDLCLTLMEFQ